MVGARGAVGGASQSGDAPGGVVYSAERVRAWWVVEGRTEVVLTGKVGGGERQEGPQLGYHPGEGDVSEGSVGIGAADLVSSWLAILQQFGESS